MLNTNLELVIWCDGVEVGVIIFVKGRDGCDGMRMEWVERGM